MIRAAILADLWVLRRRPRRRIYFYNDALLASSYHAYLLALRSTLDPTGSTADQKTLVLRDHGIRAYLQARRRPNTAELDLQYLTTLHRRTRSQLGDGDIFYQLIADLLRRAAGQKIERVFAALGTRAADVSEVLRQLGFQAYAQQAVWMLPAPTVEAGTSIVALRRQQRRDAWAIHQLYCSIAPRHVQQAELRDSRTWQTSRRGRWIYGQERGWVLGDDEALTVYMQLRTGSRGHVLRLLVAPHLRAETAAMVRYVLSQLHDQRPVFVVLRSYQSELGSALEELGFVERGEQTLHVKHLALLQRQAAFLPGLLRAEHGDGSISISTVTRQ